jgi:hypothetical protein
MNRQITVSGTATSEGFLARSVNGNFLTCQGYDSPTGVATIANTDSTTVNRVFAMINGAGVIDTTTAANCYNGAAGTSGNPRSSVSINGGSFWMGGTGTAGTGGPWYAILGGAANQTAATPNNTRVVRIFGGQLYLSSGSGTSIGVNTVGAGTPFGPGETTTRIIDTSLTGTGTASPYEFHFADARTCYIADDRLAANGGGIQKWTEAGGVWTLAYTLNDSGAVGGIRGLTGTVIGGNNVLFCTSGGSTLYRVEDTGVASTFTALATAPLNTAFRGVAITPGTAAPIQVHHTPPAILAPGAPISGTSLLLDASDDQRWVTRPGVVLTSTQDPIGIELTGTLPGNNPSVLGVSIEGQASAPGIRQRIQIRNYSGAGYDILDPGTNLTANSDTTIAMPFNPVNHIGPGNEVKVKLSYRATAPILVYPWVVRLDHFFWSYLP